MMGFFNSCKNFVISDANLTNKQLKRLSEHRYNVQNNSTIEPYLNIFWNRVVEYLPLWLSPNLITVAGFSVNLLSVFVLLSYHHNQEPLPRWAFFLCALSIFVYQTLDGLDGKQARRTGSSSPLGELFDHGCDAFSQVLVSIELCSALYLNLHPNLFFTVVLVGEIVFYCSHWQAYVSGKLIFNNFDCEEALLCTVICCLISGFAGPELWLYEIFPGVPMNVFVILLGAVLGFFGIIQYLDLIFSEGAGKNGSSIADTSILSPITPFSLVIIPQIMIYTHGTSSHVFADQMPLFCFTFGLISAKISLKLIIAHLTRSPLKVWDTAFCGPIVIFLNQYYGEIFPSYYTLIVCLIYCSLSLLLFCLETVRQISQYLKISCFRVNGSRKAGAEKDCATLTLHPDKI